MSRAEFVRLMVEERAEHLKDHNDAVRAALECLEEEYDRDEHASRADHGGRPPSTRWALPGGHLP